METTTTSRLLYLDVLQRLYPGKSQSVGEDRDEILGIISSKQLFNQTLRGAAVDAAFSDEQVDSVIVCFIPPVGALEQEVVVALRYAASRSEKPPGSVP